MSVAVSVSRIPNTKRIKVMCPFHPAFPNRARLLGGTWMATQCFWHFDYRDEAKVRNMLRDIYGTDGTPTEEVTVRLKLAEWAGEDDGEVWVLGRRIVRRPSRDSAVRLGEGCVVVAGSFPSSGGSMKHPVLGRVNGVTIEVRDVPKHLIDSYEDGCFEIVDEEPVVLSNVAAVSP